METWAEVTAVDLPLVSFRHWFVFDPEGDVLVSDSTLRFRSRSEIEASLEAAGLAVQEVRNVRTAGLDASSSPAVVARHPWLLMT